MAGDVERRVAVCEGEIHNRTELLRDLGLTADAARSVNNSDLLLALYEAHGQAYVEKINGSFAFALYDNARHELTLGRDRFGIETLYYYDAPSVIVFASRLASVLAHPAVPRELNPNALRRYLAFGFNPAFDTFFHHVRKLRPGHELIIGPSRITERRYWALSFQREAEKPISEYSHDLVDLMRDSIRLRMPDSASLGIFLSGGMDSSSVAGLTRALSSANLTTFSYRCLGRSFDESHYARVMAAHCCAEHHEVVFQPADVRRMEEIVRHMDEPLCNAAITVATYLLGEAAQGKVGRIFSGDGGDELFGGHPVYAADRIGAIVDKMPPVLTRPLFGALRLLPDSDQKLSLVVKLKRFAESIQYPKELGTYRWRIQYGPDELKGLVHDDEQPRANGFRLFDDLLALMDEADGPDMLSRSLYVDTITEVGFYLRRMDLVRSFGLRPVFPLLDHRLFEYAARIPSKLKFRDASNTKFIQHRAMEGLLPDEIVHRKDKLGHSIPLKNWLRSDPEVKSFVRDTLSGRGRRTLGLVDDAYVQRLWEDHQRSSHNNSHRLWTLTVLELWLRANHL
jgi:asparagine synthase (glutamine-hydrolysing)